MDGDFLLLHRMQNGDDQAIESFVRKEVLHHASKSPLTFYQSTSTRPFSFTVTVIPSWT